jgi:hypothetical protein
MLSFLLSVFRPYKYELLIFALVFIVPMVFLLSLKFKKFQSFILVYCIWMMHRFESFETVSFFYETFKGSQYSISIHHVDILLPAVFFACIFNKQLSGRIRLPSFGLLLFFIFFFSQFLTGDGAPPQLWIRKTFSIFAHLRMLFFYYFLSELLKIDYLRKDFFRIIIFLIIFTGFDVIKLRYLNGVQKPNGAFFMTYNQMGYIICSLSGIFLGLLLNNRQINYSKSLLYLIVGLCGVVGILSQNRGAQMNLFFTTFGVLGIDLLLKLNIGKIKTVLALIFFGIAGMIKSYDTLYDRYFGYGNNPAGTMLRKAFYVRSYESFRVHKFTGLGANLWSARVYEDDESREAVLENQWYDRNELTQPYTLLETQNMAFDEMRNLRVNDRTYYNSGVVESYWFLCLVEYGLVAFIPLVVLWLYFYYQAFRNALYFRTRNIYYYGLSTGLFGTLTGCIVHNVTEWCGRQSQAMYFIASYFALVTFCSFVRKAGTYEKVKLDFDFFSRSNIKASTKVIADPT